MKKFLLLTLVMLLLPTALMAETISFAFTSIGSSGWPTSYGNEHKVTETGKWKVTFSAAVKQTQTITDVPVSKAGTVTVQLLDGSTFSKATFNLKQWGSKKQSGSIKYSTDGTNFTDFNPKIELSSTKFDESITATDIPENVIAIQLNLTNTSNQIGIASFEYEVVGGVTDDRDKVEMKYSQEKVTAFLGEAFDAPVLNVTPDKYATEVTYTSLKTDVATVAADGTVTITDTGVTTITATIAETEDTHHGATASYTLTVLDPNDLTDTLTPDLFDYTSTAYAEKEYTSVVTGIRYNVKFSYSSDNKAFQFNYNNDEKKGAHNSGLAIYSNPNAYSLKSITVEYGGTSTHDMSIYSNDKAYTELYYPTTNAIGVLSETNQTFIPTEKVYFVSLYPTASGAFYIKSITFQWSTESDASEAPVAGEVTEVEGEGVVKHILNVTAPEGAQVRYAITENDNTPAALSLIATYNTSTKLHEIELTEEIENHVWAQTTGLDGKLDSEIVGLGVYDLISNDPDHTVEYTHHKADLIVGHSYIVVAMDTDGTHYALGDETADGNHKAIELKGHDGTGALTVAGNKHPGFHEYIYDGNGLLHVLQNTYLAPKVDAQPASLVATAPSFDDTYADGAHLIEIGGKYLGFDDATKTFGFTDAHDSDIKMYTTGSEVNTGVDGIAADDTTAPVEYYNLQGMRVSTPGHGLYLRRKGTTTVKVVL